MIYIFCCVNSAYVYGVNPYVVHIEADIMSGMPSFNMVGLLASEVREAKERVRTAIKNSGYSVPFERITVNLSPADRKKEGSTFDLAIAIALLTDIGMILIEKLSPWMIVGELGLNGEVKPVHGILPMVMLAKEAGFSYCMIPEENAEEGLIVEGVAVIPVANLKEAVAYLNMESAELLYNRRKRVSNIEPEADFPDFSDIVGNEFVKEAVMIAVCGRHNLLMTGPPGTGKSMIASRIPGIMPKMSFDEQLEVTGIQSINGILGNTGLVTHRPFRAPHHTITASALIGGGMIPKSGELTLAHRGVLFLDELPEFQTRVLDALRQPLEEKKVHIIRTGGRYEFPADCLVIGAMNPCKCGYYPDRNRCQCSESEIRHYLNRLSGPFLDRMDICIEVPRQDIWEVSGRQSDIKASIYYRERIEQAVERQKKRNGNIYNSCLTGRDLIERCEMDTKTLHFLKSAYDKFLLSMRGYYKVLRVARTIADLKGAACVTEEHIAQALSYRVEKTFQSKY